MPINTSRHPKTLWPGIKEIWSLRYDEHPVEYTDLYDTVSSSKRYEEYVQEVNFPMAQTVEEGASVTYATTSEGYTVRITNVEYGLGYIVTQQEQEDNQYMEVSSRRAGALAFSFRQAKETVAASGYNDAFDSSAQAHADGKAWIATDHPLGAGGTFSNELDPGADLSHDAIEDLTIQIMGAVDEQGMNISIMPRCLIVPRQEWYNANRILKSTLQSDTAENAQNVLKSLNVFPDGIKMNHYLDDADAWFIRTNITPGQGLVYQERIKISFTQDNDFDTSNAKAKGRERYAFGLVNPRAIYGSQGV